MLKWDTPERIDTAELIDDEAQQYEQIRASMKDVQHANRFLGGVSVVSRTARKWVRRANLEKGNMQGPLTFLDVATGSGDLPVAILKIANKKRVPLRIIGLDFNANILKFAREETGNREEIRLVRGSAFQLPYADASIDYVLCSLAFHHFGYEGSVAVLAEMERVARRGWLVNDLRRAWSAWFLFRVVSTLLRMHPFTRHDGPASVLRAYSCAEYLAMPQKLGLEQGRDFEMKRSLWYRVALIRNKL